MRLLKKTITTYFIYSAILLIMAIPVFYWALKKMMIKSVDENLVVTKTLVVPQLRNDVVNHRESNLIFSGYDIHYAKVSRQENEDSIFDIRKHQ